LCIIGKVIIVIFGCGLIIGLFIGMFVVGVGKIVKTLFHIYGVFEE
jgi:hypothetical protein